ncbi:hypothetical protein LTR62_003178 [Meristemomyces frigidus]|uniref:Ankyrin repeat protein n=1 Tax=Meristemomyces frigidus TaxID=1508187 RepID=A0AAN7YPV9_9PEZI|nr:hypothetical protein LTR62_003178 [Meristemomyces frigidus]
MAKDALRVIDFIRSADSEDPTACLRGAWPNIDIMRMLLEHGADQADFANDREALDWLLDQGVGINLTDTKRTDTGQRPEECHDYSVKVLNNVAANGDIELFDHLEARGANAQLSMALHCASKCHDAGKAPAMIDHLLDVHRMDIEADNEKLRQFFHAAGDFGTPLNCAVYHQNLPALRKLLERGAVPDKTLYATIDPVINDPWLPGLAPLLDAGADADDALERAVTHLRFGAAEICVAKGCNVSKVLGKQQAWLARFEKGEDVHVEDEVPEDEAY